MQPIRANVLCRGLGQVEGDPMVTSVVTDNRAAQPGSLFVCIRGERVDGHDYAAKALQAGACAVVAQHPVQGVPAGRCVLVQDPLDAMIRMGANYRALFAPVLVGVTGSVGKTTTKEFCYAVFSAFGKTLKTQGNQNNEIGMPNTLFRLDDTTRYAVIEMGMQGLGEIEKLTLAAKPCGAIITCVGQSHLEQLGTRENILKAKMEICAGLPDGAPLVVNQDNDLLSKAQVPTRLHRVSFGIREDADVRAADIRSGPSGTHFTIVSKQHGSFAAHIPAMGEHNVYDALAAWALAVSLGLNAKTAAAALEGYKTTGHRQNIVPFHGLTVIEDCYNANPDSMRAALHTLAEYPVTGRRIAVLGDMFELGDAQISAHRQVGDEVAAAGVHLLITVGDSMQHAHERAQALGVTATHCASREQALEVLLDACRAGDTVLVKASHGMQFEKILSGLYAGYQGREQV